MTKSHSTRNTPSPQRGSADLDAEPRFLVIGRIVKPHGINGELRIESITDLPERFTWLETVYLEENEQEPFRVEGVRFHKKWILLKLKGIDDRTAAEAIRRSWLYVPFEKAISLKEDEYFLYQLMGIRVADISGEELGVIVDVLETSANNVFVLNTGSSELLIPDIPDVILDINFEDRIMTISLLPGLIDR